MVKSNRALHYLQFKFLNKKKFRFFSRFVLISLTFWIITKLSNTYNSSISFNITLTDIPDFVIPKNTGSLILNADIIGSGIELLLYKFINDEIIISLKDADFSSDLAHIDLLGQQFSIQQQLFQNTTVNQFKPSILTFEFDRLIRKKLPILALMDINYELGFERSGDWVTKPDSVWVSGPSNIMDTLTYLPTENFKKNKVDRPINKKLRLREIPQLKFDFSYVKVTALVNRFTEKTLETFVNIKNLPDSLIIKLFPQSVQTTFIVLIDNIEEIKSSDFLFYCDFNDTKNGISNSLNIKLGNHPQGVRNIRWSPKKLDYLIRQ